MTALSVPLAAAVPQVEDRYKYKYLIAIAVTMAAVLELIDTSIVNVAIPHMMGNLGATLDEISWVSTGYIIANVIRPFAEKVQASNSESLRPRNSFRGKRLRWGPGVVP